MIPDTVTIGRVQPAISELYNQLTSAGRLTGVTLEEFATQTSAATRQMFANIGPSERTLKTAERFGADPAGFVTEAMTKGMTLTAALDDEDPTDDPRDAALGSDALTRLVSTLVTADNATDIKPGLALRTQSDVMRGVKCHTLADLHDAVVRGTNLQAGRALLPEIARRAYKEGEQFGGLLSLFYASNYQASPALSPEFVSTTLQTTDPIRESLLGRLVAITQNVPRGSFKYAAFIDTPAQARLRRVPEGAPLPLARLNIVDREAHAWKYGVLLETTYEAMRRLTIELWRFHLARIGQQNALDMEQVGGETLINGDGNANTAATEYNNAADLGGTAGVVTLAPILNLLGIMEENGQQPNIAIGARAAIVRLLTGTFGSANYPIFLGTNRVQGSGGLGVSLLHPDMFHRTWVPAGKVLYSNGRAALGRLTETGSSIVETDKYIRNQTEAVAVSEINGFFVNDPEATTLFDIDG